VHGKSLIRIAGAVELATGLGLIVVPQWVAWLLFRAGLQDVGPVFARVCGIALFSIALGCAPRSFFRGRSSVLAAMLALNGLLALYLALYALTGGATGVLLWPAVAVHAVLAAFLAREFGRFSGY
jgi:predicted Na+-dependent transporter